MRKATFYYDFISHNAYLAWAKLAELGARHEVCFDLVPVVFGALLKAHGQLGPAEVPAKSAWMIRDVLRKAVADGLPIAAPYSHPFNPLVSLRVASLDMEDAEMDRCVRALFEAAWARSLDVSDPSVVAATLNDVGLAGDELVRRAGADETKARLRERTADAVARGVFGVPSVLVDDQLFWGYDDLASLEAYLRGEDPSQAVDMAPWLAVRPTIQRKR